MTSHEHITLPALTEQINEINDGYIGPRGILETEIARIGAIGTDSEAAEAKLIAAPGVLEDEGKFDLLQKLGLRTKLAPKRVGQLQIELDALDARFSPIVDDACNAALWYLKGIEDQRYATFCNHLAPHYDGSLANMFFQPQSIGPIKCREFFQTTASFMSLHRYKTAVPHPQHDPSPAHVKAATLLKLLPTLPRE